MARGETRYIEWQQLGEPQTPGEYSYGLGTIHIDQSAIDSARRHGPHVPVAIEECSAPLADCEHWVIRKIGEDMIQPPDERQYSDHDSGT